MFTHSVEQRKEEGVCKIFGRAEEVASLEVFRNMTLRDATMTQWVKIFVTQAWQTIWSPKPMEGWKERTYSSTKLTSDLWHAVACVPPTSYIDTYTQTHIAMQIPKLRVDSEHKNGFLVGQLTYGPMPERRARVQNRHPSLWYVVWEFRWRHHHGVWWLGIYYALSGIINNFYAEHGKFVTTGRERKREGKLRNQCHLKVCLQVNPKVP